MSRFMALGLGVVLGVIGLGGARLASLPPRPIVHFHANWAVWIDGARVDLSGDRYMEDVAACIEDPSQVPVRGRVHMHENNQDVVHVHHSAVSWGHLLQNLGWGIGPDWIYTDTHQAYRDGEGGRLTFILNGLVVPSVYDRPIAPGDRLLISFGAETPEALRSERFPTVASDAPEYDGNYDPAGCAGVHHESFGAKLRRAFWF